MIRHSRTGTSHYPQQSILKHARSANGANWSSNQAKSPIKSLFKLRLFHHTHNLNSHKTRQGKMGLKPLAIPYWKNLNAFQRRNLFTILNVHTCQFVSTPQLQHEQSRFFRRGLRQFVEILNAIQFNIHRCQSFTKPHRCNFMNHSPTRRGLDQNQNQNQ